MKKILVLFFLFTVSLALFAADSGTCGNNLTWVLNNKVLTISGTGDMYDYTSDNGGYTTPWYDSYINIQSVVVSEGVTSIGNNAFTSCLNITSVSLPNTLVRIGEYAFTSCEKLRTINIPAGVRTIGKYAFADDNKLTSLIVPEGVTTIEEGTFSNCTMLASLSIPESVKTFGLSAFANCSTLTSIYVPKGLIELEGSCFYGCSGLTSCDIPDSITVLKYAVFNQCSGLKSMDIPYIVTKIEGEAFMSCSGLKSITIPSRVTTMGDYAFGYCTGLTSVTSLAMTPPRVIGYQDKFFKGVDCTTIPLYVPLNSISDYSTYKNWSGFTTILPICATETATNNIEVTPLGRKTELVWKPFPNAVSYEWIVSNNGDSAITLVFDAQGQLVTTDISKPFQLNETQQTPLVGYAFTVSGLLRDAHYTYTLTIRDSVDNVLDTYVFPAPVTVVTNSLNDDWGVTRGDTIAAALDTVTIIAIPNYGYHFTQWNDGNTDNPRTIILTQDTTFTAEFGIDKFIITFLDEDGTVLTSDSVEMGSLPIPPDAPSKESTADYTYTFAGWVPEIVPVTSDATYTATYDATPVSEGFEGVSARDIIQQMIIINGQIYILQGDKIYTLQGQFLHVE